MKKMLSIFASLFYIFYSFPLLAANVSVQPNGTDDWHNLQNILNNGNKVVLTSGATYKISQRLNINHSNSGIITSGTSSATIIMLPTFNYANPDITSAGPRNDQTNGIGIYIGEDLGTIIDKVGVVSNITLSNFHLKKEHVDGSYVNGIWVFGAKDVELTKLELSGFSLGYIIALDSVENVQIKYSIIRDSWANSAPRDANGKYFAKYPQLTGIQTDDNKITIPATNEHVLSKNVSIVNNTITRLRFGNQLFNMPRSNFIGDAALPLGFETDGITLGNSDSPVEGGDDNIIVAMNEISEVGEGIDTFSTNYLISNNVISDTFLFGVKLIHGARDALIEKNLIRRAGLAGVVLGGSPQATAHVSGNLIRQNLIESIGDRSFACGNNVNNPTVFKITHNCGVTESVGIWIQHNNGSEDFGMVKNTYIVNNTINKGIVLEKVAVSTLIFENQFIGEPKLTIKTGATGTFTDIHPFFIKGSNYHLESTGSLLIYSDFNGDSLNDVFIAWPDSGKNYLYVNSSNPHGNITTRYDDPLPRTGINGNPTHIISGNFDGDNLNKADLLFVWSASGENRLAYNFNHAVFNSGTHPNPIPPMAINGTSSIPVVGDFDGNGKDDICFIWKNDGLNRCAFSQGFSSFTTFAEIIGPQAINGNADDVLSGDFNGDGKSDLYFIWRNDGTNRLFYGNQIGSFRTYQDNDDGAPIGPLAINGSPEMVMAEDLNQDGIYDIDFMWQSLHVKRLFLGQPNDSFTTE